MANNTGFLLMAAGLGALLFLGRGGTTTTADEDNRVLPGGGGGGPTPPAFNLQSYVDSLFGETATVPVQPPVTFFYPKPVVVTSSGVPAVVHTAPEIITPTTKVQIGGDGGETIVASSLAIIRQEQLDKQLFQAAANVQTPKTEATAAFNRDEEARQRAFADKLVKAARDAQAKRNAAAVARTREQQEYISMGLNPDGSAKTLPAGMSVIGFDYSAGPPVIAIDESTGRWTYSEQSESQAGRTITVEGSTEVIDVDFSTGFHESFVISGGMDSPGFASEDEQPYQPATTTVHELTAAYDLGF
jgi:hypothetical protein